MTIEIVMIDTIDQDVGLLSSAQAGMNSSAFVATGHNDDEMRVQRVHDEVKRLTRA